MAAKVVVASLVVVVSGIFVVAASEVVDVGVTQLRMLEKLLWQPNLLLLHQ